MNFIKTKSFGLAVSTKGTEDSERLAIVLPGRFDTKDYINFQSHINYFASRGFLVLTFDPPGSWGSSGDIDIYTTTNYLKAVDELIEYFGNKPTLLLGHSRGGTVAILVAGSANPNVIGFVVIMATYGPADPPSPDDIRAGFKISYRDLPPGNIETSEQRKFVLPISYFKDAAQYDSISALKKSTKPKLLFYGTNDQFTKPERVKEVYELTAEPKMLHELNSDHDYRYHQEIIKEVNEVVGQFLDKFFNKLKVQAER